MIETNNIDLFNEKFLEAYRNGQSNPTNPNHHFGGGTVAGLPPLPSIPPLLPVGETDQQEPETSTVVFGHPLTDYISVMLPNGVTAGSRHAYALKLAKDLAIISDGNMKSVKETLLSLTFVNEIVNERGMEELDRIIDAARKYLYKRESEYLSAPQPSKDMQRAIEAVCGRKYNVLVKEANQMITNCVEAGRQDDITKLLIIIATKIENLMPHFPLIRLLCKRQKKKHYIAIVLVAGAFLMTLMTRCWYRFWSAPGRKCRLNSLLALIGRMGSGKHIAVDLYKVLMEPIEKADAAQVAALNRWNEEHEQNSGANKNKTPRPNGCYRRLPPETSAAGAREAECNAHETVDGEEMALHISIFDSELDNTLRQMKKNYMDAMITLWLKCYHNEPHGSFLKTSSAKVGEYDVHFNGVYTGTEDALNKLANESNFVNGLLSRFTTVPMGDSNFEMMEAHYYDEEDAKRDAELREWAYKLDSTKGEIPCKEISDALHQWTARRMADAKEDESLAEEDLVKRPCWHGINNALPYIVARHWDQMVESDGRYKCGSGFKVDKYDVQLALLIAQAQLAFQEFFFKALGEKHYDNREIDRNSNVKHQQKTKLAFNRLSEVFSSDDVDKAYGYKGNKGSICSRLKRLVDDGLAKKIRSGENKGKYQKLT